MRPLQQQQQQQRHAAARARAPAAPPAPGARTSGRRRSGVTRRRPRVAATAGPPLPPPPPPPPPPPRAAPLPPDLRRAWTPAGGGAPMDWHPLGGPSAWQGTEDDAFEGASPLAALSRAQRLLLLSDGSVTRHLQIVLGAGGGSASASPVSSACGSGGSQKSSNVRVECLAMDLLPEPARNQSDPALLPTPERDALRLLRPPLLRRQVLLRAPPGADVPPAPGGRGGADQCDADADGDAENGAALVYAASWWNASDAAAYLGGGPGAAERPIWAALTSGRLELHRRVLGVERGACARLWSPPGSPARGLLGGDDGDEGLGARGGPPLPPKRPRRGEEEEEEAAGSGSGPPSAAPRELWGRHYVFWAGGRPLTVIYEVFSPRLMEAVDAACRFGG